MSNKDTRKLWYESLIKITYPILLYAANDQLKDVMPVYNKENKRFQYLEAIGRTISGISCWIELEDIPEYEKEKHDELTILIIKTLTNISDPNSKIYTDFNIGSQVLVDTAYLVLGFLRGPNKIWNSLSKKVQANLIKEIKKTRNYKPSNSNWLLFASIIEAFLLEITGSCDYKRLNKGVKSFICNFYKGDGIYGDGIEFSNDYYNSYVIHPMLLSILEVGRKHRLKKYELFYSIHLKRLKRYSEYLERLISPEGTYPVIGRTLICRYGAMHALSLAATLKVLPESLSSGQVRSALSAVLKRQIDEQNFDSLGFINIGFNGKQYMFVEKYVSNGSSYHCVNFFLPLGLPVNNDFWREPEEYWTSYKAYNNMEFISDHCISEGTKKSILLKLYSLSTRKKIFLFCSLFLLLSSYIFFFLYTIFNFIE